ncbi:putative mitochondrial hypothetical protein [Leptomonas pyrrhocoris]|uniref:Transmembrane protein n=1 Tax=Leptomonas pyrrhocoris TaxID=157538 RepID=A0A0M9FSY0_LEPPY|nr:putative mitochondrial hypothetical protein [Leptomonas pyrrhocoris]XP_015653844.1 putative mitochondrial hypothetical protein [Leptomonas pyrrhocoris]XP_015653845.1 putative mitochondrial hypothetical protein [Leptomonas pyrrhocoris]KPA75404.1 putative mitochondrial hypothetical protein [Leptomonas pyrrhocoris]KPA75405.1 putative mitochondrial hypothetical protein [Leptomonas pyrrhocoris]KPA75406.1 putative mitochondrial hypothetical protein [Leptomonas pyrrhocoris]|eukprot:XP_015653843.1 putative mitochondrial hypothetical protein [Leptomonas pyrrhocoris]
MRRCACLCVKAAAGAGATATATASSSSTPAASSSSTPPASTPADASLGARTNSLFEMRQSPTSLYVDTMHSNTLTDHPLTHRSSRDELAYRKRKLTERGQYEQAANAEEEAARRDRSGKAGAETKEYYWAISCAVLGYLTAHAVVFNYYYPDDLRPNYSPDRGYSDEVAARREQLEAVDEMVGLSVLEGVYSKQKAVVKRRFEGV